MKIRKITEDDYEAFRKLRLEALQDSPTAFGSDYEREAAFDRKQFNRGLKPAGESREAFVLGAWTDSGQLIGMAGFYATNRAKLRHKGCVWGMYVAPEFRSQGAGSLLLKNLVERASHLEGLELITLSLTADSAGAKHLYEKFGFTEYGREPNSLKVDGVTYDEIFMVRKLDHTA